MADQVTNYKCPACTGPLHYVGSSGKLECDYCGSSFDVAEIEKLYGKQEEKAKEAYASEEKKAEKEKQEAQNMQSAEGEWDTSELSDNWGTDAAGMRAYNCPSCGAELICDETTAATSCPYCGNPTVIPGKFSGGMKPDYILPFKLDQKTAEQKLREYYKGKRLLPNVFKSENKIKEIKGVYVPFWLYDGMVDADVKFRAESVSSHRSGDYEVTETKHFDVHRAGTVAFTKIPVDASTKMPNDYMDSIEPFHYAEMKPFSTAYLPGYLADQYDEDVETCAKRADKRAVNTAIQVLASDVTGYTSCTVANQRTGLKRGKVSYGLLPVYMLTTRWNGENYLFAMNGQTGKFVGKLPIDRGKYWRWFLGITAGVTAILGSLGWMLLG